MGHTHVHLLSLEVHDRVLQENERSKVVRPISPSLSHLPSIFEGVLISRHRVVGQNLGEPVRASGIHEVGEEVHVARTELILILHVHVDKVLLTDL